MAQLSDFAESIRSKNAGPFWLTVDVFFADAETYGRVRDCLPTESVARQLGATADAVKRFDIDALNVIKFSLPRPEIQGTRTDRDMHGAAFACLLGEIQITANA